MIVCIFLFCYFVFSYCKKQIFSVKIVLWKKKWKKMEIPSKFAKTDADRDLSAEILRIIRGVDERIGMDVER